MPPLVLEVWREGKVALRYSAGSKAGFRKDWRAGSATCADLGSKRMGGMAGLGICMDLEAALLFWRLRAVFESHAMVVLCTC
jgi:hypothetical protein